MKTARIWLLLLLAVLLPSRGAAAAAMVCHDLVPASQSESRVSGHGTDDHTAPDAHHHAQHDGGQNGYHHEEQSSGSTDKCNLCSDCCSVTPLMSSVSMGLLLQPLPPCPYPDVAAPAPSFFSDGQERPPRTL